MNTCQNLLEPAKLQTLSNISTRSGKYSTPVLFSESAIGHHLLDNLMCAKNYSDGKFTIYLAVRLHLFALDDVFIKSCKPNLCRQNDFVYNLKPLR